MTVFLPRFLTGGRHRRALDRGLRRRCGRLLLRRRLLGCDLLRRLLRHLLRRVPSSPPSSAAPSSPPSSAPMPSVGWPSRRAAFVASTPSPAPSSRPSSERRPSTAPHCACRRTRGALVVALAGASSAALACRGHRWSLRVREPGTRPARESGAEYNPTATTSMYGPHAARGSPFGRLLSRATCASRARAPRCHSTQDDEMRSIRSPACRSLPWIASSISSRSRSAFNADGATTTCSPRACDGAQGAREWVFYEGPPTANGQPGSASRLGAHRSRTSIRGSTPCEGATSRARPAGTATGCRSSSRSRRSSASAASSRSRSSAIAEFNARCRESVQRTCEDWAALSARIGMWIDTDRSRTARSRTPTSRACGGR